MVDCPSRARQHVGLRSLRSWFAAAAFAALAALAAWAPVAWGQGLASPLTVPTPGGPGAAAEPRVDVSLHAAGDSFEPGKPMWVGIRFDIEPRWHIYWRNPGDAGMATSLEWTLPAGWEASRIHWPLPRRFVDLGGLRGFGYEDHVVLLTRVTAPADGSAVPVTEAPLSVRAQWLACRDRCVMGEATLQSDSAVVNPPLLADWRKHLPVDVNSDPRVLDVQTSLVTSSGDMGPRAVVAAEVSWASDVAEIDWFPHTLPDAEIVDVVVTTAGRKTTIEATVQGMSPRLRGYMALPGVLVYRDSDGVRRGAVVTLELRAGETADSPDKS
jgi:DsbC/DsbD-like thiol-disulfide interchange protein